MILGEVVGTVVATRKTPSMDGLPLLLVRRLTPENTPADGYLVAVDLLGAGVGEVVLLAAGSSARQNTSTDNRPIDAVIMAVVDTWQMQGNVKYIKQD